jgi:alpha-1,3-glucosyltransferase
MDSVFILVLAITIRLLIGQWNYSGYGNGPMFGDFEAQRHWLEITVSLPIGDWYRNTTNNDLQYWGLDYPPVTAYFSLLFGTIANNVYPKLVALFSSRGIETTIGKMFMRWTVIISDLLVFIPAVFLICKRYHQYNKVEAQHVITINLLSVLFLPSLLLIDHGHFQYNSVCIGFALLAIDRFLNGSDLLGCVLYCLSLNYKQMALYYAPVYFFSLLRKSFDSNSTLMLQLKNILLLGLYVIFTFFVLWLPFCIYASFGDDETCQTSLLHVLQRQFPFSRGIFEDKVSNVWYVLSVIVDIRKIFSPRSLVLLSLTLTMVLLIPVACDLLTKRMTLKRLLLSMVNSSLAFFLGSYQVDLKKKISFIFILNIIFIK